MYVCMLGVNCLAGSVLLLVIITECCAALFLQSRAEEVCVQLTNEYEERLVVVRASSAVWLCAHTYVYSN